MRIKTRLIITFMILISLVIFMGSILIIFGIKNRDLSERMIFHYNRLILWRDIYKTVELQWRSLNYYIILADKNEKDRFIEQHEILVSRIESLIGYKSDIEPWFKEYIDFSNKIQNNFKETSRDKFFEIFAKDITQRYNKLISQVDKKIKDHNESILYLEKENKRLNGLSIVISVSLGLLAIILGITMSFLIFKSIINPLNILQNDIKIIGEGNLEHNIIINSKDEIGELSQSFNNMVQNLKNLQLKVLQMDRMSSIGQLAGGVAHEINNPLTGVLGQAQLVLTKIPQDHPLRPNIEKIESAAQRCRRIVRALLDFARDKNYHFSKANIAEIIDNVLDFTKTELELHNISLIKDIPSDIPNIKVSIGHIQQVFINIISNAIQAMEKDGGKLYIKVFVEDKFINIMFKDTGIGIKKENLEHVFDPFFTTKEVGKGTGLGLTISYGIIQKHGGKIIAESEGEGKGATFIVILPIN